MKRCWNPRSRRRLTCTGWGGARPSRSFVGARGSLALLLPLLTAGVTIAVQAQNTTYTWIGSGMDANWQTYSNWIGNIVPVSSSSTTLDVTGSTTSANDNIAGNFLLNEISFDVVSTMFNLTGGTLEFQQNNQGQAPTLNQNTSAAITISNNLILDNTLTLTGTGAGNITLSGAISGSGGLVMSGNNLMTLANSSNSYSGGTVINSGTLNVVGDSSLGDPIGSVTLNGGVFQFGSANFSTARSFNGGGSIDYGSGTTYYGGTFDTTFYGSTLTGTLNMSGSLTVIGGNTLTLTGGTASNPSSMSELNINAGTTLFNGANLTSTSYSYPYYIHGLFISNVPSLFVGNATAILSNGAQVSVPNGFTALDGFNTAANLTVTGMALLNNVPLSPVLPSTLSTNYLEVGYGGAGLLNVLNGGAVKATYEVDLGYDSSNMNTITVSGMASLNNVLLSPVLPSTLSTNYLYVGNNGAGVLNVQNGGAVQATSEVVLASGYGSGGMGTVTVDGVAALNGTPFNPLLPSTLSTPYLEVGNNGTGVLNVQNGGAVQVSYEADLGYNTGSMGTAIVTGVAALNGTPSTLSTNSLVVGLSGAGVLDVQNGGLVQASTLYLHQGSVTVQSGGSLVVAGQTVLDASGVINQGTFTTGSLTNDTGTSPTLQLSDPVGGTALTVGSDGTSTTFSGVISDAAGGSGSLTKVGSGTLTLTGNNTCSGATLVTGGILALTGASSSSAFEAGSGATLELQGIAVNLGIGNIQADASGVVQYSNQATITGGYLDGPGMHQIVAGGGGATFNNVTLNVGAQIVQSDIATFNHIDNSANMVSNAVLNWNHGDLTSAGILTINSGATDNLTGVYSNGVITVNNGGALNYNGNRLVLGGGSQTYVGSKDTPGGLMEFNGSTTVVPGNTIELNSGLLVNNGIITGTVDVNNGSLAKGAGNYAGGYNVNAGGNFIPGNSPGTLLSGSSSWNGGGKYTFQIDEANGTAGTNWGLNQITGTLTINAGSTPASLFTLAVQSLTTADSPGNVSDFVAGNSYSWTFLMTTQGISGFDPAEFTIDTSGFSNPTDGGAFLLEETDLGKNLSLIYTPQGAGVPEGSTLLSAGLMLLTGSLLLRRRQKASYAHKAA